MSESKHTKGNWKYLKHDDWGKQYVIEIYVDNDPKIFIGVVDVLNENHLDNANLITAAPDMLAALERASRVISNFMLDHSDTPSCDAIEQIQSAIRKAKGES